jgi:hypothetical protein
MHDSKTPNAGAVYVVAAVSTLPGPPGRTAAGRFQGTSTLLPVGVRHAVPRLGSAFQFALCGALVTGWVIMVGTPFPPGHPATCHRCSQLVLSAQHGVADAPKEA